LRLISRLTKIEIFNREINVEQQVAQCQRRNHVFKVGCSRKAGEDNGGDGDHDTEEPVPVPRSRTCKRVKCLPLRKPSDSSSYSQQNTVCDGNDDDPNADEPVPLPSRYQYTGSM